MSTITDGVIEIRDGKPVGYMTVGEAAEKWGVKPATVRILFKRSRLDRLLIKSEGQQFSFIKEGTPKPIDKRKKENK